MKRMTLLMLIGAITTTPGFAQTQPAVASMSFTGPTQWNPGTTLSLNVNLTTSNGALALAYWLEVPNAIAPSIQITNLQYFPPWSGTLPPFPVTFTTTAGARPGYMSTNAGFGGTAPAPPGTSVVMALTFSIAANALPGAYTMFTTSLPPRVSAVTDTNFGDDNIIPPGQFVFTVVPEPSTLAMLALGTVASGLVLRRRRKTSR